MAQASPEAGPEAFFRSGTGRLWVLDFRRYDAELSFSFARVRLPLDLTPGLNLHLGPAISLYHTREVPLGSPLLKTSHHAVNFLRADVCRVRVDLAVVEEEVS